MILRSFQRKGLGNSGLRLKALPLNAIISYNTFKVTNCDLKNKDSNMADKIEKRRAANCVYHIGASIKDLGKKWFGFSKMEILTPDELVERINKG